MQFNISNLSVYMDDIASMWSKDIRQKTSTETRLNRWVERQKCSPKITIYPNLQVICPCPYFSTGNPLYIRLKTRNKRGGRKHTTRY